MSMSHLGTLWYTILQECIRTAYSVIYPVILSLLFSLLPRSCSDHFQNDPQGDSPITMFEYMNMNIFMESKTDHDFTQIFNTFSYYPYHNIRFGAVVQNFFMSLVYLRGANACLFAKTT